MSVDEAAVRFTGEAGDPVHELGGGFMVSRESVAGAKGAGVDPWAYYTVGRCGVLGDSPPEVVTAALAFFPHDVAAGSWRRGRSALTPEQAVASYLDACRSWGRRLLADVEGLDRLGDLLARVAGAADRAGLPLFAGWAALPLPDDAPGRAAQLLQVLREHRGGLHTIAVLAAGLTPLEAVLTSAEGARNAEFFGWPEPYPDVAHLAAGRPEIEEATNRLAAPAWSVLSDDERGEAVTLLQGAVAAVREARKR